ncbi:SIMPL domain-containing protein [Halopseudomonas pelagia]|uniref:SIMPL domain-containing protein n=1 Tax=Halopseudomonas pelagia TaxID=553151 RepID=UPI0003A2570D|nr:SIMPL domain-containing protein [Halopseudomonas pelagia]
MRLSAIAPICVGLALASAANGLMAEEVRYNQVSLRAEVQQAVSHDTLQVRLYAEDQDKDAGKLAGRITDRLNKALETARQTTGVSVSSGNRSSQPVYDEKREKIVAWRERGDILLESTDFASLSTLTGKLMGELNLGDMQFSLSPENRRSTEDELIREAIEAFKARADIATRSLGGTDYKIVNLNLNSQFMQPPMYRGAKMAMMADAESASPSVEGGQADVTVSADGVIEVNLP